MCHIIAGGDKHLTFRRPSATAQSDSSSDTGCGGTSSKAKHKDVPAPAVPASAPQMRYNRAFRYTFLIANPKEVPAD